MLDISEHSLNKAKQRLGDKAEKVNWIVSNIIDFSPSASFDLWHDRAAFHFLAAEPQVKNMFPLQEKQLMIKGFLP
ncbi:MAG: class I SAM-dependent methyltransferase [Parafilimonas sp.]